ncbi:MAG: radical SAM protein [Myxococcales bacterium]|nr:radical SAM protein [Myxococcales bacterium]
MTKYVRGAITPTQLVALTGMTIAEARHVVRSDYLGRPVEIGGHLSRASFAQLQALTADAPATAGATDAPIAQVAVDGFRKYLRGGVECVAIPLEKPGHYSACVSSQGGCAMACSYCATGTMGLMRNLGAHEILDQVKTIAADLPAGARVAGVVFQGMGEPMANLDAVLQAIAVLNDSCAFGIDARKMTVSTCGLPRGILRLAQAAPKVRLGVSVGSLRPDIAETLLPIRKQFPWREVFEATASWARHTGHAPMWAVTLLAGKNDTLADADALAAEALRFRELVGVTPRLSVIAFNPWQGTRYARSSREVEHAFIGRVMGHGLAVHRRYSGGGDIAGACGQLAGAAVSNLEIGFSKPPTPAG